MYTIKRLKFTRTLTQKRYQVSRFYDQSVEECAQREPRMMQIEQLLQWGNDLTPDKLIRSANWLRQELPVRIAKTLRGFQNQPYIIAINPHMQKIMQSYWNSFSVLSQQPPIHTLEQEQNFSRTLHGLLSKSSGSLQLLSQGVSEINSLPSSVHIDHLYMSNFISRFLMQRLSRTMLADFHLALHSPKPGYIGTFNLKTSPKDTADQASQTIMESSLKTYGVAPRILITGDLEMKFTYIPALLLYVLMEVLSISTASVVNKHKNSSSLPDIVVRICDGDMVTIVIQDQGGGLDNEQLSKLWLFTREKEVNPLIKNNLAHWGFGLCTSRVYVKYLGGELQVVNVPGHGTVTYVRLTKMDSTEAKEQLHMSSSLWDSTDE